MNKDHKLDFKLLASNRCSIWMRGISGKSSKCKQYDENEDSEQDFTEDNKKESNRISCKEWGLSIHKAWGANYFTNVKTSTKRWIWDYCSYLQNEGKSRAKFMQRPVCPLWETDHPSLMMKEIKAGSQFGGRRDDVFSKQFVHIAWTEWYSDLRLNNMEVQNKGEFIIFSCDPKSFDRSQIKKESMLSQWAEWVGKSKNRVLIPCIFNEYYWKSYFHMSWLINKTHLQGVILIAAQLKSAFKILVVCPFCAERMTTTISEIKENSKSKLNNDIHTIINEFVKKNFVLIQPTRLITKAKISETWARYFPDECNQKFSALKSQKYTTETEEFKKIRSIESSLYSVLKRSPKKKEKKEKIKEIEPKSKPETKEDNLKKRGALVKKMLKFWKWKHDPDFKPENSRWVICYRLISEVWNELDIPLFWANFWGQLMHAFCYYGIFFQENLIQEWNKYDAEEFNEIINWWTWELCTELQKLPFASKLDYTLIKKFDGGDYYSKIPQWKIWSNRGGPLRKFIIDSESNDWYHPYWLISMNSELKSFSWPRMKSLDNIKQNGNWYDWMKKGVVIKWKDRKCNKSFHIPCCINLKWKFAISQISNEIIAFWEDHSNIRKKSPNRNTTRTSRMQACGKEPRMLSQINISNGNQQIKDVFGGLQIDDGENELEYLKDKDFFRINWNHYNEYFELISDHEFKLAQNFLSKEVNFSKLFAKINSFSENNSSINKEDNEKQKQRFRVLFEMNDNSNSLSSNMQQSEQFKKYILAQFYESKSSGNSKRRNNLTDLENIKIENPFMSELNLTGFDPSIISKTKMEQSNFALEWFSEKSKKQVENMKKYNNLLIQAEVNFMLNPELNYSQRLVEDQVSHFIYGLSADLNSVVKELNNDLKEFFKIWDTKRKIENQINMTQIKEDWRVIDNALQQVTSWKKLRKNMMQGLIKHEDNENTDRCWQIWFIKDDNNFNQILYWRQWKKGVHQFWYGFHRINTIFVWDECQYIKENELKLEEQKEILAIAFGVLNQNKSTKIEEETLWIIWKKKGGILKMIHRDLKDKRRFVHIFCCITSSLYFIQITNFQNFEFNILERIESTKSVQNCEIWHLSTGYTVDLFSPSNHEPLFKNIHSHCAWLSGYPFYLPLIQPTSLSLTSSKYHELYPLPIQILDSPDPSLKYQRHLRYFSSSLRRRSSSVDTTCTLASIS